MSVVNDILRPAAIVCLKGLPRDGDEFRQRWEAAREVLAWLCVLAVKPEWVREFEQGKADFRSLYFEIPVMTELGLEILSSRYRQMETRLPSDSAGRSDVFGTDRFPTPVIMPKSYNPQKVLDDLLMSIWNRVFPAESRMSLSVQDKRKLNATLATREKNKTEHHYLAFAPDQTTPLNDPGFLESLLRELPNLVVIRMVTSTANIPLLTSDEFNLLSEIISFLEIPTHLSKLP